MIKCNAGCHRNEPKAKLNRSLKIVLIRPWLISACIQCHLNRKNPRKSCADKPTFDSWCTVSGAVDALRTNVNLFAPGHFHGVYGSTLILWAHLCNIPRRRAAKVCWLIASSCYWCIVWEFNKSATTYHRCYHHLYCLGEVFFFCCAAELNLRLLLMKKISAMLNEIMGLVGVDGDVVKYETSALLTTMEGWRKNGDIYGLVVYSHRNTKSFSALSKHNL